MSEWTSPGGQSPQTEPPPSDWATPAPAWGAPPPGWDRPYAATAPRPGIIPLRPLGVGELLDGAFTAMRRYPRATLGLSAIVAAVQQLLGLVVDLATNNVATPDSTGLSGVGTVSGVILYLVNAALSAVLVGMLAIVIGDAVIGRKVALADVWRRVRPLLLPLLGAAFLTSVLPVLGLVGLIVGGVILWVALSFTTPALVLERLTVRQALRRSWRLAMPAFWRVLGVRLLAMLIAGVVAAILSLPGVIAVVSSVTGNLDTGDVQLSVGAEIAVRLSSLVATTVTAPITAGVLALLYIDRRMRAEALDVALARAAEAPAE
jgi:hypothetical protein